MEVFAMGWSLVIAAFMFVLGIVFMLSIFGLPGNWIMIFLLAVYHFAVPGHSPLGITYWCIVLGVAVIGEVLEFFLQVKQSKKYGSSTTGTVGGVIGAIIGAIMLAPFLFGIGAFIGALLGAWTGCFLFELLRGQEAQAAMRAALGAMFGRFLGTVCKLTCGVVIWIVSLQSLWPDPNNLPFHFEWIPSVPHQLPPESGYVLGLISSFPV